MKLIVGLGNPEDSYAHNRHNVGARFCEYYIGEKVKEGILNKNSKLTVRIAELNLKGDKTLVCTPLTFMNESGSSVAKVVRFYKISLSDLYVVHDDLDIRLGEYKIQRGKGPQLHNGVNSIEQALSSTDFWRIRIGVDNRKKENRIPGEVYVLQNFSAEELKLLQNVFWEISQNSGNLS